MELLRVPCPTVLAKPTSIGPATRERGTVTHQTVG
jgi:hypothetical protein